MKISHLLFDIDNTLYSGEAPINKNITRRMILFAENFLNVPYDEAVRLRKEKLPVYGSTLNWLRTEYNFTDIEFFFNTVHPAEEEKELIPDPNLRQFLQTLNLPMTILTNAPGIPITVPRDVSTTYSGFAGIIGLESKSIRLNLIPVFGSDGRTVAVVTLPVCNPLPEKETGCEIVRCFSDINILFNNANIWIFN